MVIPPHCHLGILIVHVKFTGLLSFSLFCLSLFPIYHGVLNNLEENPAQIKIFVFFILFLLCICQYWQGVFVYSEAAATLRHSSLIFVVQQS